MENILSNIIYPHIWLLFFNTLFVCSAVIIFVVIKFAPKNVLYKKIYRKGRNNLLTSAEREFFWALTKVIDPKLCICPKVRIADLIEVNDKYRNFGFWLNFNKISQKHVDFVICTKYDFAVCYAIELDDKSHLLIDRKRRDDFVDQVFSDVDIPLVHIKASREYNISDLKHQIAIALDTTVSING